ncbi:MAG: TlpA family protein disulfide reductase [Planctomycetes bacterium]|nr:TlpA family protein disulfide reductase [Planctomycetota bacterium]
MRILTSLVLSVLTAGLAAQGSAKDVYDKITAEQKELSESGRPSRDAIQAFLENVKSAIETNADALASGEGLYYRGQLQMMARDRDGALASFKSYLEGKPTSDLAHEARMMAAQLVMREDEAYAKQLVAAIDSSKLSEQSQKALEGMQRRMKADEVRNGLTGKALPAIAAVETLNAPADFSIAGAKGKVLVLDFWATWCPPCRAIIPDLVKLQEKHKNDGVQVVGVTRYYGYGMDFDADSKLPHGGKSVGGRTEDKALSHGDEITINEHFATAFELNYPIVFTEKEVAGDSFGIMGIPTVFVVGRDGKVVGHIVGGGEANHEKLEKLIEGAIAGDAADASAKKGER